MQPIITENREKIAELCRAHHVRRLSVFGSAVRDDFDPERSDVDLLVDFAVSPKIHFAANFFALQKSLAQLLQRDVDLVADGSIRNPYLLRNIQGDAQVLYAS
jgi:predicted nucleotidyltransferase